MSDSGSQAAPQADDAAAASNTGGPPDDAENEEAECCAICLDALTEEAGRPETCRHRFHLSCLLEWARINTLCPYCKGEFSAVIGDDGRRTDIAPVDDDDDDESESEEDEDVCAACGYGGELLICDGDGDDCVGLLHVACAGLDDVPEGEWFCVPCEARRARRARHEAHARRVAEAAAPREPAARRRRRTSAAARRARARGAARDARRAWREPTPPAPAWTQPAPPADLAAAAARYLGRPRPAETGVLALARQVGDGGGNVSARAAEIMRRRRAGQGDRAAKALVARFISASREDADRVRRGGAPFRVAAACADLRRLGAGAALGGLYGAAGCAAALQALEIACGAVCGVLASITPGPASGTAEIDARRALRRRLEAIAGGGGVDAATARTAASRLAPPRPPPPPKRRRSAVTDLILGS
jgi:hypothetical protein